MTSPGADVSVRIAWGDDAEAIAGVHLRAWPSLYGDLLDSPGLPAHDDLAAAWRTALGRPSDARHRVLVSLARNRVTGYVLTSPASDPDTDPVAVGEIQDLTVDPDDRAQGHGSRLLQAGVDTLVADHFTRAVWWVNSRDDALRKFLTDSGWAADGAHRELALDENGEQTVRQVRLHTEIA